MNAPIALAVAAVAARSNCGALWLFIEMATEYDPTASP